MKVVEFESDINKLKSQAHKYFDMLWKIKYIERNEAYLWLSKQLEVEEPMAHMSKMNESMCKKVIENAIMILNDMRRLDLDFGATPKHPYYELKN